MNRRAYLAGFAAAAGLETLASVRRIRGVDTRFELVRPELAVADPPAVSLEGQTALARGTVQYGSSACGSVDLAHAAYERSQERLDLLVVASDDTGFRFGCTDDLIETGYRLEATVRGRLRRVTVTEHHLFGETYSTTVSE
ncbi:hypothetical protein [Natronobiforma cellulositropha]|uniref:hypothetical protein n=1 Tax=Natronobiforma cellulositropha TaxID=1679076 RepID=UPI0021D5750E|nr:hypothetical protein [Natronobiforma cellulositropha]